MQRAFLTIFVCACLAAQTIAQERQERTAQPSPAPRYQSERASATRFGAGSDSTAPVDFQVYRAQNPAMDLANSLNLLFRDRKDVVVVPDALSNTLLIRADPEMSQRLTEALSQLDRSSKTVRFEVYLLDFQASLKEPVTPDQPAAKGPPASHELKGPAEKVFVTIDEWKQQGRVTVLNHFELAAVDNNPSRIQFGARKPRVTGAQLAGRGGGGPWSNTTVSMENVGTLMAVTSRVNSDGRIIAEVDFEKSFLGSDEEGRVVAEVEGREKIVAPSVTTLSIKQTMQLTSGAAQPIAAAAGKSDAAEPGRYMLVVSATVDEAQQH